MSEQQRPSTAAPGYRPEIDGLRAIAVLAVLLFHLGIAPVQGGFVGVDIFFVISGYLITSILLRDLQQGRFSLLHFYRRRALRILPPLIVVLAACVVAARFILLPGEVETLGRTIVATALFFSNIFFWSEFSYFTPDAKENPLLHTWSLGVEEQFYILVPIFLWLLYRFARRWLVVLFAASVVLSFALSVAVVNDMPKATFYLLPTRYWELGIGALLAMWGGAGRLQAPAANALSLTGIALMLYGLLWINSTSTFPAWNALPPTVGALLVIAAGPAGVVGKLLSHAAPVWIGKISYSLYLWHWPVIVFYKLRFGPALDWVEVVMLGILSVVLAAISTRFAERPFRTLPASVPDGRVIWASGAALVVVAGMALALQFNARTWRTYPPEVGQIAVFADYRDTDLFAAQYRPDQCFIHSTTNGGFASFEKETCLPDNGQKKTLLLLGDSHAAHLWRALSAALPEYEVQQANASGCLPLLGDAGYPACTDMMSFIYGDWVSKSPPDTVVLSARWEEDKLGLILPAIAHLKAAGVRRVVVLGPTVEYLSDLPRLLARDVLNGSQTAGDLTDPARQRLNTAMQQMLANQEAVYIPLLDIVCPGGSCRLKIGGDPMQFDYGHYTAKGAEYVARELAKRL